MSAAQAVLPKEFIWRRLHSLMGLWLVLFLMEHLLVNSQAALFLGNYAQGFVSMVNSIHNLPYLEAIELFLLGVPIAIHLVWGIKYLFTSEPNSRRSDGSKVSLPEYKRNRAYTWQRITSWILMFMLIGHVVKFRFLEYPSSVQMGTQSAYFIKVNMDDGLYLLAERLGIRLYDAKAIEQEKESMKPSETQQSFDQKEQAFANQPPLEITGPVRTDYDPHKQMMAHSLQQSKDRLQIVQALEKYSLQPGQVIAQSSDFGTASLLAVRNSFKNPIYVFLYTIFVLSACFHAFNGFWTFLITWGVVLKMASQKAMSKFAVGLMVLVALLGLAAIWGTYWIK